jgi:deazaflavin-dependent oxidoreductase (nitroreductase family)
MDSNALGRLKRAAGKRTLILTHYGRKSGKPYDVTIWFALVGDKLYIGTANVNRQWVRNVQKTPRIRLAVGGEKFEGEAHFLAAPADRERGMAAIRRKYWIYRPIIAVGQVLNAIGVMRDKSGAFEVVLRE